MFNFLKKKKEAEQKLIDELAEKLVSIAAQDEETGGMTRYIGYRYSQKFLYKVLDRALEMDDTLYVSRVRR